MSAAEWGQGSLGQLHSLQGSVGVSTQICPPIPLLVKGARLPVPVGIGHSVPGTGPTTGLHLRSFSVVLWGWDLGLENPLKIECQQHRRALGTGGICGSRCHSV